MDLWGESSKSNLEDEKDDKLIPFDANKEEINEEIGFSEPIGSPSSQPKVNGDGTGGHHNSESSPSSSFELKPTPIKGYGLKKWRRIRRDLNKDFSGGADSLLILKRRLSVNESSKLRNKNKLETEGGAFDRKLVGSMESGGFTFGVNSDNSEDQGSNPLVKPRVPKLMHEIGFGRDRSRIKIVGGRGASVALQQRSQRGRGSGVDFSKKMQGDRIKIEKENLQSSVESSYRNFDGARSGYYKENDNVVGLSREGFGWDILDDENKITRESVRPPFDPFSEPIDMLQAAKEALESEIEKIGVIGKAAELDDFDDQSEETEIGSTSTPEAELLELSSKIEHLQYKLDKTSAMIKAKESKVNELEDTINRTQLTPLQETNAIESELEGMLKTKIEAEIEFLVISRTTQRWKISAEKKLRNTGEKDIKFVEQAEELESYCKELLGTEKILKLRNKVCKFSFCSFIQLLLLCVGLVLFLVQLMPPSDEFVPT